MTQLDLNRQVARATGESLNTIAGRGFSLMEPGQANFEPEPDDLMPQLVDWDALDGRRRLALSGRHIARAA